MSNVKTTSVSITLNAKSLGVDAYIKLEETRELGEGATAADAILVRDEVASILGEQILEIAKKTAGTVRSQPVTPPVQQVTVYPPVAQQYFSPTPVYSPPTLPAQVVAAANGGGHQSDWRSVPSKFGDGDMRYLSTGAYPTSRLEQEAGQWLAGKGLNPTLFKIWDNRPGPRGLEAGVPNGSVAAIKVSRDIIDACPADFQRIPAARVKFNSDGSLYIYFTKEFEAFLKFGGSNIFSQTAPVPVAESPFK